MAEEETKVQEEARQNPLLGIVFKILPYILAIAVGAVGTGYITQQKPELLGLSKGSKAVQAETDTLVSEVGKLIALPSDEKPTVATVTDASKVKDQPFFANAKNGDQVLIYTNAKKAILYRPTEKRVIEVGAVNINQQQQGTEASPTPEATAKP